MKLVQQFPLHESFAVIQHPDHAAYFTKRIAPADDHLQILYVSNDGTRTMPETVVTFRYKDQIRVARMFNIGNSTQHSIDADYRIDL